MTPASLIAASREAMAAVAPPRVLRNERRSAWVGFFVFMAAIGWGGLTAAAVRSTPKETLAAVDYSGPTDWMQLSPEEMVGIAYFRKENCVSCHDYGKEAGKNLNLAPDRTLTFNTAFLAIIHNTTEKVLAFLQ